MFYDLFISALPFHFLGNQTMIFILGFFILSFIASSFVVAACALSSRISSHEAWKEDFEYVPDMTWETAPHSSS